MSGSEDIVRQFNGQIPGQATGQNAVAKTYVDDELAIRDEGISNVANSAAAAQGAINTHEASGEAHSATAIVYSGPVAAANAKEAIDTVNQRVSTIVAGAGASNAEILDARQPATGPAFPILGDRLNAVDAQLAETADQLKTQFINIKFPPPPYAACVGGGIVDDYAAFQALINLAQTLEVGLYIPADSYRVTQDLTITRRLHMYGDTGDTSRIVRSGAGKGLVIRPPADRTSNTFYHLHHFGVYPEVDGQGTYGIDVILDENAYFSNWEIDHIRIGDFGSYGIHFNNDVLNVDGFFTGTIRRCWIQNGINGGYMGDSLNFIENTVTGKNVGFLLSQNPGATQFVIEKNNITCNAGAIALIGATQPQIKNNQMEYLGDYMGTYDAFVALFDTSFGVIEGNTITPYNSAFSGSSTPSYAVLIDGDSKGNTISKNLISVKPEGIHIALGISSALTVLNTVTKDNKYGFSDPEGGRMFNGGINNFGVDVLLTLQNGWVQYDTLDTRPKVQKTADGLVVVGGSVKSGAAAQYTVITNLPIGFRPKVDRKFQCTNFDGTDFKAITINITPTGDVVILSTGVSNVLLQLDGIQY